MPPLIRNWKSGRSAALVAAALTLTTCVSRTSAVIPTRPGKSPTSSSTPSASPSPSASPTPSPFTCAGYAPPSIAPEGNLPSPRRSAAFIYDKATDQTILFGGDAGQSAGEIPNDTWIWNGPAWSQTHPATAPPCWRSGTTSAFDDATGQVVLFGGQGPPQVLGPSYPGWFKADTWTWNGTNWSLRDTHTIPGERSWGAMAFLPGTERLVMFGGFGASNPSLGDTWLWDGQDWGQLWFTEPTPPSRSGATLAYDGHRLILFGGLHISSGPTPAGTPLNDTWAFDGTHWQQLHPPSSPPARSGAGLLQRGGASGCCLEGLAAGRSLTTCGPGMDRPGARCPDSKAGPLAELVTRESATVAF